MTDSNEGNKNSEEAKGREKIMQEAIKLFAQKGLAGTTVREIAQAAGLNLSLISYYFGGKEGLYKEIFREHAMKIQSDVTQILSKTDRSKLTAEQFEMFLKIIIDRMIQQKIEDRDMMLIMQRELIAGFPHAREIQEKILSQIGESVCEVIKAAQKKGIVRSDINPYVLLFHIIHAVDGYFMTLSCRTLWEDKMFKIPKDIEKFRNHMCELILKGCLV